MACSDKPTQWPLRIVLSQFWLGLQNKNKQKNVTNQVFLLCVPYKTTSEATVQFKSSLKTQRTGVSWKQWSRWAQPYFCLHKHKARDGKRHPQHYSFWWTTTSYPGRTSQAERAADQPVFFQAASKPKDIKQKGNYSGEGRGKRYKKNLNYRGKGKSSMAIAKG